MSDLFSSSPGNADLGAIGPALRAARKRSGLTGGELARRAQMSQAKISRLETGTSLPDPADVRELAKALDLSEAETEQLVSLAVRAQQQMRDERLEPLGISRRQGEISEIEGGSSEIRVFNPALVPGLLQTSSYAKAVVSTLSALTTPDPHGPAVRRDVLLTVSRRMSRQSILSEAGKKFYFVITESVLGTGIGTPEGMREQLDQLRDLSRLPNVSIRILPSRVFVADIPMHMFEVIDNDAVIIDLFNTSMTAQGRSDIKLYLDLFERLQHAATADVDALFDKYHEFYGHTGG